MSIWPLCSTHFVELPYTLPQDCTPLVVFGEKSSRRWLEKIDFIERYFGMALLNTHPDYLLEPARLAIYAAFLQAMKARSGYWHALPAEVARQWRKRHEAVIMDGDTTDLGEIVLEDNQIGLRAATQRRSPVVAWRKRSYP